MRRRMMPDYFTAENALQVMGGGQQEEFDRTIDLLVWNIYKGRKSVWHDDFLRIIKGKNLVLLQESIIGTRYDATFQEPKSYEWVMARTHKMPRTLADTGVKTGAVVPSLGRAFLISPDVEPIFKTPKMLLATTYPIKDSDKTLMVVNIHAINFVSFKKYARQLAQMVSAIENHEGPVILAGDFNTWNKARYRNLLEAVERMGLVQVMLTRKGRWHHFNQHLDHIFYRGLNLKKADVLRDILSSDHYPLTAQFEIL